MSIIEFLSQMFLFYNPIFLRVVEKFSLLLFYEEEKKMKEAKVPQATKPH